MMTAAMARFYAHAVQARPAMAPALTLKQELQALGVPTFRTRAIKRYQLDAVWKIRARFALPLLPVLWGFLIAVVVLLFKLTWVSLALMAVFLSLTSVGLLRLTAKWETVPLLEFRDQVDPEIKERIKAAQRIPDAVVEVDQLQEDPIVWVRRGRERVPIGYWNAPGIEAYNP